MNQNRNSSQSFSMEQAMAFASTPAGRRLMAMLQSKGGTDLENAKSMLASGNLEEAKKALSSLLSDPQIQDLLKQYGE